MWYLGFFRLSFEKTIAIFEISDLNFPICKVLCKNKIVQFKRKCVIWMFLGWNLKKP